MIIEKNIAYEDEHLFIVKKPVGIASQSERGFSQDLLSAALTYRVRKGEPSYGAIINRLDKPVGGLVLIAKDKQTAQKLSALSGEHSIEKWYYAVVEGELSGKGEFSDYIQKDEKENQSFIVPETEANTGKAKRAKLLYEAVRMIEINGVTHTLLRVRLLTGRHHQIRVQMAYHGHPLYGDMKYNATYANQRGVSPALFAYHLSFQNPYGADHITVECEPDWHFEGM